MNEQNNLNNNGTQPQQPVPAAQPTQPTQVTQEAVAPAVETQPAQPTPAPAPVAQEVAAPAPTTEAAPVQAAPVVQETAPVVEAQPTPAPVTQEVAAPTPTTEAVPVQAAPVVQETAPVVEAQPTPTPAPVTQEVVATAPATEAAPVQAAPVVQEAAPVVEAQPTPAPVTQEVVATAPTTEAAPPAGTDIVVQEAINPLANEPAQPAVEVTNNAVITPSVPLTPADPNGGAINSSNVGFVAVSEGPKKKKNKPLIIGIVVIVLVALILLGYFVIYPFVINKFFSDPRKVYEAVIRTTFNDLNTTVTQTMHDKSIYDLQFSFDSNIPTIQEFGGYTYGITVGADPKNEKAEIKFASINRDNQRASYESYLKDGKHYLKYHNRTNYIYTGEANLEELDSLFGIFSFSDLLKSASNVNAEDTSYLITKFADLLIGSLDNSKLSKEEASINVNGETLKVFNNKYQIDAALADKTVKHILSGLMEDDKALDIVAKMLETESTKLKETLKTLTEEEENTEDETEEENIVYTFSIYTTIGISPKVIGFGLKNSEDESTIHYYNTNNYFEIRAFIVTNDTETNKKIENNFDVIGKTANGKTKVSVLLNDKEFMNFNIKDWSDTLKDLEYAFIVDEKSSITGTLKLTHKLTEKNVKNSLEFSLEMGEQFVAVAVDYSQDWNSEVANIASDSAVTLSDDQIMELHNSFLMDLYNTPIGVLFQTVSGDVTPEIGDYYDDSTNMMEDPMEQEVPDGVDGAVQQFS